MTCTVIWVPAAEDELIELWLSADDRASIAAAANRIDALLKTNPLDQGESRPGGRRILRSHSLGVTFSVHPDDRLLQVLHVWRTDQRRHRS